MQAFNLGFIKNGDAVVFVSAGEAGGNHSSSAGVSVVQVQIPEKHEGDEDETSA